eukprot:8237713-Ditylum_brightwellii.AAC.2
MEDAPRLERKPSKTFQLFIKTLPLWEQKLLRKIREIKSSYATLKIHLQLADSIWIVTERGLKEGGSYFGWVIATHSDILWESRGHIQGNPKLIESMWTEGVSHLAALVFLKNYSKFHDIHIPEDTCVHFMDNMGIAQVEGIYMEMNLQMSTKWVKGH